MFCSSRVARRAKQSASIPAEDFGKQVFCVSFRGYLRTCDFANPAFAPLYISTEDCRCGQAGVRLRARTYRCSRRENDWRLKKRVGEKKRGQLFEVDSRRTINQSSYTIYFFLSLLGIRPTRGKWLTSDSLWYDRLIRNCDNRDVQCPRWWIYIDDEFILCHWTIRQAIQRLWCLSQLLTWTIIITNVPTIIINNSIAWQWLPSRYTATPRWLSNYIYPSLTSTFRELLIMGHYRLAEVSTVSYSPPLSGHYWSYEHVRNIPDGSNIKIDVLSSLIIRTD